MFEFPKKNKLIWQEFTLTPKIFRDRKRDNLYIIGAIFYPFNACKQGW